MSGAEFSRLVAGLLDRPGSDVEVQLIATAFLRSGGRPVGVLEADADNLAAIRLVVGSRRLTIPARVEVLEAIEDDPDGDIAADVALALAEGWTADWSWASHPAATRIWFDPFGVNNDPELVSPTIR